MPQQVLIIHGWSDTSASFHPLADFLEKNGYQPKQMWLGDYISLDDDVRVADVGRRMGEVIDGMLATGELGPSFDVIVHSTGGLVTREWLTTRYRGKAETCPMKRLVMLAPANFGSKLAATGKSFLGRLAKGYNNGFQTGQSMLNDLELSSPYQWELAQRDVLKAPDATDTDSYYGADRVWPFVIVGTHPYNSLFRQIVNENGADGTVRVCAANMNARGATINFNADSPDQAVTVWGTRLEVDVPLAVLPTRTHGSVTDPERAVSDNQDGIPESAAEKAQLGQLILQALACTSFTAYKNIQAEWDALTEGTAALARADQGSALTDKSLQIYHQYMQANCYVVDDYGKPVPDYFLEFSPGAKDPAYDEANLYLHAHVIEDVKVNSQNTALRNIYLDRSDLIYGYYPLLNQDADPVLMMSVSAASPGPNIDYFTRDGRLGSMEIPLHFQGELTKRWLRRNATHFLHILIPRVPKENVFKLTSVG
ncbi:esterase/lipase family protein [Undibacterium sp.]|uniref:esterase/lipase family protein n=1 Tax=Undibacterium sp. TaxID=1914977 RepID=UPI00374D995D